MILLHRVNHVLTGLAFAFLGQEVVSLKIADGANVSGVLIDVDHTWVVTSDLPKNCWSTSN
jgi:hypothetical protein